MNEINQWPSRSLRWTHEYMFSLNLAWAIVWFERETNKVLGGHVVAGYIANFSRRSFQLASPTGGRTILDQLILSFFLATICFFLLRLLSQFSFTNVALSTIAGVFAITAFPVAAHRFPFEFTDPSYLIGLELEVIVVLVCGILYYLRKSWLSNRLMLILLLFHFALWSWATDSYYNIPELVRVLRSTEYYHPWGRALGAASLAAIFYFGFPIIGFFASVTWVRYVRRVPQGRAATT